MPTARQQTGGRGKYIVSDNPQFIYFVVPKVACTSIKSALLPLFEFTIAGSKLMLESSSLDLDVHRLFGDSRYQINRNQLDKRINRGDCREHFKFAFVRNPWDRLVSCYSDKILDVEDTELGEPPFRKMPSERGSKLFKGMPFAEFVETVCEIPDEEANGHFVSQHEVICGSDKDNPIIADFVGRFENLAADFAVVAERIRGTHELRLPHRLRSISRGSRPYTEFYDDRLRTLVHERYRQDIETFNYAFGESHN
jgi:chondroitin 4-sulfotransferase 11